MSDFTTKHRARPRMSREEYLAYLKVNFNRSEEDLAEAGLQLAPCPCGHDFCSGWLVEAGPMPAANPVPKRIGRPPVGEAVMLQLTVPIELKADLEAKALSLGMTVPDARRQAYKDWIEKS